MTANSEAIKIGYCARDQNCRGKRYQSCKKLQKKSFGKKSLVDLITHSRIFKSEQSYSLCQSTSIEIFGEWDYGQVRK